MTGDEQLEIGAGAAAAEEAAASAAVAREARAAWGPAKQKDALLDLVALAELATKPDPDCPAVRP